MQGQSDARKRLIGIALLIVSASLFGIVDGLSKILAESQSVAQIVWARYALSIPILFATTRPAEWRLLFHTAQPKLQIVRALMPLIISATMVLAVRYLPLAEATVILFAGPFLVVVLAAPLLGERVHPASWIGVIVGFAAVVIVARPGFGELSRYVIFPLIAAVFYALLQLYTRRLSGGGERASGTLAWTLAVGALIATPLAILTWQPVSTTAWVEMISLGFVFGISHALMIRAFAHAPANILTPFSYAQVVSATIVGMTVFDAVPDVPTAIGIVMIIGAGVYVMRTQAR